MDVGNLLLGSRWSGLSLGVAARKPGTVLAYIAWRIAKRLAIAVYRDWFAIITTVWVVLTFYLWERGNSYRDDARREREAVERLYKERE